jgi:hypothetical protein
MGAIMSHGSTKSLAVLGLLLTIALFGFIAAPRAEARTITIKAVFRYTAPDGTIKPVRYAYVELRDSDTLSDDVISQSYTGFDGSVTFQYDSEMSDGWLGGRIDAYLRCYPKLYLPSYDMSNASGQTDWTFMAQVGKGTGTSFFDPVFSVIDTPTWNDNNEDRTDEETAGGETAKTFANLDYIAVANFPISNENPRAPMALGLGRCISGTRIVRSAAANLIGTKSIPQVNAICIENGVDDFDSLLHEYGHCEMYQYYGKLFGNYDCTRSNHNFEEPLKNKWYLPSDAEWSALAEGWADFCPVITKRLPIYQNAYNVETVQGSNLATASGSCEGTVCRIFWDIADTWQDKTLDENEKVIDRPLVGGMALDDDPMGFAGRSPYSDLPGLEALKDIIRLNNPKSLWGFRDAWRTKFAANRAACRALDATFWINGLLHGEIQENPPDCSLLISGATTPISINGETRNAYCGDVTLTADVHDLEADDRPFLHVYFYWTYINEIGITRGQITSDRNQWYMLGEDIDGSNGFSVGWPKGKDRPLPGKAVCLIAVASDFMQESATTLSFEPENRTGGQIWNVVFGESEAGGGGTGTGKPTGPLTEVGYYSIGGFATGMRVHGDKLYIAGWGQGLQIVDISVPESPRLVSVFRPSDITRTDNSRDVDIYVPGDPSGGGRLYAVIAYGSAGMRIVDVTNPAKPVQVGSLGAQDVYANRVRVVGSHAYFWDSGQAVVDISNPARPGPVVKWLPAGLLSNRFGIHDAAFSGDTAYLACNERGLAIQSLADILAPKQPGSAKERPDDWKNWIRGLFTNDYEFRELDMLETGSEGRRLALCLNLRGPDRGQGFEKRWDHRLSVLDVTEPKNIREITAFDLEGDLNDVAVDGSNVFVGRSGGVTLFDFADPWAPKKICDFKGSATYSGGKIEIYKDYLFVLVANDHLGVLKLNR